MTELHLPEIDSEAIAIIGMSGRFPGAKNIDEFWQNLKNGVESIRRLSDEELLAEGVSPELLNDPNYVKANPFLEDADRFDASFFGYSPKEATLMDPQQRLFLECASEALENAGYDTETYPEAIGIYAGVGLNNYLIHHIAPNFNLTLADSGTFYQLLGGNGADFLTTRISYKLNLKGPSLNVQTACSTSLVALDLACESLLEGKCKMALAGGVSLWSPRKTGYSYQEGLVLSPDGHCRAFDAKGKGMLVGNGVGIVAVKRLEDAVADGDTIHAIIKGTAINNDGNRKVGFTAPSVEGQAAAISEAQEIADIDPETITYIEAHGTATPLGDPVEIKALTKVFRAKTQKKGFCGIGSVKTNIGHLDTAAGVASLIKTVLALKHKQIPPSLNFETPNPECDFENSPFYVNTQLKEWESNGTPRRAGVSSFGMGGTNAHVVLEEWNPPLTPPLKGGGQKQQLLLLSAKTATALETATVNLANHLKEHPELNLADAAYTLAVGRKAFDYRRIAVASNLEDAANTLLDSKQVVTNSGKVKTRSVVFMFSGQGSQYVNMTRELYETQTTFTEQIDKCCQLLQPHLGFNLRDILYPSEDQTEAATEKLKQTAITQPALFVIEYALAQLWMSWGIKPFALIGHSIGEYVAATIAGVFSLKDALTLVTARGQLMQSMPSGSMLAVPLPEDEVKSLLEGTSLEIATINSPENCVVSGTTEAIEAFEKQLAGKEIDSRRLHTSHAYHSSMMEGMLEPFTEKVKQVKLNAPTLPFVSNLTGTWITAEEATNPSYYAQHLCSCVRFADGVKQFFNDPNQILLEVGPGRTLSTLAKRHRDKPSEQITLTSVRHPLEEGSDVSFLLKALGQLWLAGTEIDWTRYYGEEKHYRIPLPTYPFERKRYWIDPPKQQPNYYQVDRQQLWQSVVEAGLQQAQEGISKFEEPEYLEQQAVQERMCVAYTAKTLKYLGIFANPEDKYSVAEIFKQFPIKPDYKHLLTRWLEILVQHGMLQQEGEYFFQLQALSTKAFNALVQEFQDKFKTQPEEQRILNGFGEKQASIIMGEEIPQNILFAGGDLNVYDKKEKEDEDSLSYYNNAIMRAIVEQVVKSLSPSSQLKILEIGAGQGLSTNWLLPILPGDRTHYTYTDIGLSFLNFGKNRFKQYPFIEYRKFDMEKAPEEQGFKLNSYDLIVANNCIHVTSNMGATLDRIRSLVASGGLLILMETTQPSVRFDMIYGLLMPSFEDPSFEEGQRNSGKPFLSKEQWQQALQNHGFVEVKNFPEPDVNGYHIILGRASKEAQSSVPPAFTRQIDIQHHIKKASLLTQDQSDESSELSERPEQGQAYKAPQSQIEQTIAQVWEQVLGIKNIGVNDNFYELGGDSLILVQIRSKLSKIFQQNISAKLFNLATIESQANYFVQAITESESKIESLAALKAEVVLDPEIVFSQPLSKNIANPKNIFLTGSTGFIGAYLLDELFKKTSADISCLVRSTSIQSARERIENHLKFYSLWNDTYSSRIIPIVGDLAKPLFGLSEEQYQTLASNIDVIYHNGAWVNHLYSYSALKPINVLGTKEVLRLASQNQTKPVHFVSTVGVFTSNSCYSGKQVSETDIVEIDYHPNLDADGYVYSKWVAENLIAIAKQRGLPACIYRLGLITASFTSGIRHKETDRFFDTLKTCILSKIAPKSEGGVNMISVEYAAQALVYLSRQNDLLGKTFHIWSDRDIPWSDLYNWIRKCGYEIEELNDREWKSKMNQQIFQEQEYPESLFLSAINKISFVPDQKVSNSQTLAELAKGQIKLSYADEKAISSFVKFLMKD